jgi:hypothetical protein
MPRRRGGGSLRNAIALWHSLAHIEFVAIDLALDMAGRFGAQMGRAFVGDFLAVAADEAMHFSLIERKLRALGVHYGALPAHDGLWEAAIGTRHDAAARLAVVPMVLEARGLDVTPAMRERVLALGDDTPAAPPAERAIAPAAVPAPTAPVPAPSNATPAAIAAAESEGDVVDTSRDWPGFRGRGLGNRVLRMRVFARSRCHKVSALHCR